MDREEARDGYGARLARGWIKSAQEQGAWFSRDQARAACEAGYIGLVEYMAICRELDKQEANGGG